jgi:hypothetical protein
VSAAHRLRWVGAEAFVAAPVRPAPAILRFDGDDFMDRMLALLDGTPQRLPELVVRHESWRQQGPPTPAAPPDTARLSQRVRLLRRGQALLGFQRQAHPAASSAIVLDTPLKLFQPVHQRYYLAAAHLVCELPGLPPRVTAGADKSGFVLRRLYTVANQPVEHAFVKPPGQPGMWVPLAAPAARCADDEEWLPVFPLHYAPPGGPRRALLGGLIPVARHDDYQYARRATSAQPDGDPGAWSAVDNAQALARLRVIAPWQGLIERAYLSGATNNAELEDPPWDKAQPDTGKKSTLESANDQLVEASWRQLQEMREYFQATFSELTDARLASGVAPPGRPQLQALLDLLGMPTWAAPESSVPAIDQPQLSAAVQFLAHPYAHASLRAALAAMTPALSQALDAAELTFPQGPGWPDFAFPLVALLGATGPTPRLTGPFRAWAGFAPAPPEDEQDADNRRLELLFDRIAAAIAEASAAGTLVHAAQSSAAARLAADLTRALADDSGPARYVLRFVHRRCDCGPLQPLVISAPSTPFQLAGFFDTDAPLRPIRIALPFDTTPGGLRKYGKNSAFIMSDALCGQMKRMRRMGFGDMVRSVLPWPFHKKLRAGAGGPCGAGSAGGNFGTICSLSIPIITIVAFILLIVIATLLDLIFRWLPFMIACFPVPGLKGKRE